MSVPGLSRPDCSLVKSYRKFKAFDENGVDVRELSRLPDSWWGMFAMDVAKDYASSVGISLENFADADILMAFVRFDIRKEVENLVDRLSNPCVSDKAFLND